MNQVKDLKKQYDDLVTIEEVSRVFENIASIKIRQIKDRVIASRDFFHQLWSMYVQLRVDSGKPATLDIKSEYTSSKTAVILISSEESLSGEIDERLVSEVVDATDPEKADYFVIGKRGARLLKNRGVNIVKTFPLPDITKPVDVIPIISATNDYKNTVVYFEQFVNINIVQVQVFELANGINYLSPSETQLTDTPLIFSSDYIFEPSLEEVINYLENMMRTTALTELILESRLAQLASRFHAMSRASENSSKQKDEMKILYSRRLRQQRDDTSAFIYQSRRGISI